MENPVKKICVVGLGYIGLPTASMFASQGFEVHGVDINPTVIETLRQGRLHIEEPGLATVVSAAIKSGNLTVNLKPAEADVFIIAVPTPYHHAGNGIPSADMTFVKSAVEGILPFLKKGNLIILESTSPAGTTRDLIVPLIEMKGFKPGKDIGVAYCPERVIPGQALKELIGNDRVIGAIDQAWGEHTRKLYKTFVSGEIFITEPTVAEMVKLLENTYRDVNIALANEVALICEKLKINVWDVIQIANRHPRVNVHKPGPGVGGHCISVDPWFLVEKFPNDANLIHLARTINDKMPHYVAGVLTGLLKDVSHPKITILGLAYKGNVDDDRESPAVAVVRLLKKQLPNATLAIYEPHVNSKEFPTEGIQEAFKGAHLAVLLTPHDEYRFLDPSEIGSLMASRVLFDAHNFLKAERWVPAGFELHVLGSGSTPSQVKASVSLR